VGVVIWAEASGSDPSFPVGDTSTAGAAMLLRPQPLDASRHASTAPLLPAVGAARLQRPHAHLTGRSAGEGSMQQLLRHCLVVYTGN
jgi:hypothetical protein